MTPLVPTWCRRPSWLGGVARLQASFFTNVTARRGFVPLRETSRQEQQETVFTKCRVGGAY